MHRASGVLRTRGNCRRRIGGIAGGGIGTVRREEGAVSYVDLHSLLYFLMWSVRMREEDARCYATEAWFFSVFLRTVRGKMRL